MFAISQKGELRREEACAEAGAQSKDGEFPRMTQCHKRDTQKWTHEKVCPAHFRIFHFLCLSLTCVQSVDIEFTVRLSATLVVLLLILLILNFLQDGAIVHVASKLCLDVKDVKNEGDVKLRKCDDSATQKWTFDKYG